MPALSNSQATLIQEQEVEELERQVDIVEIEQESEELVPLLSGGVKVENRTSSFETILNFVNLLMGMGIISIPFAFSRLGWGLSISLLLVFAILAAYTAELLGILIRNTQAKSIHDIAEPSFGVKGRLAVGCLFTLELLFASVAMLILFADCLVSLFPFLSSYSTLIIISAWLILLPLTISSKMNYLKYLSFVGILSLVALVVTILFDGFTTTEIPGSLLNPMLTSVDPMDFERAIAWIGLLFVGLDGHAVFPSLYINMSKPFDYPRVIKWTYVIVFLFYSMIGITGYLMFGDQVHSEIIQNLTQPQYNQPLVKVTLTLMALNPLTKFPLIMIPINRTIESWLKVHSSSGKEMSRLIVSACVMLAAILVPSFLKVMGFMGAFLSFLIAGIVPITCYLVLKGGKEELGLLEWICAYIVLIFVTFVMVLGTLGISMS